MTEATRRKIYLVGAIAVYAIGVLMALAWLYEKLSSVGVLYESERLLNYYYQYGKYLAYLFVGVGFPIGWIILYLGRKLPCELCGRPITHNKRGYIGISFMPLLALAKGKQRCTVCLNS